MKRILSAMLLVTLCLCLMSGCKKDNNEETATLTENEITAETSSVFEEEQTFSEEQTLSEEQTSSEELTSAVSSEESTTAAESTIGMQESENPTESTSFEAETTKKTDDTFSNEYDILRSGNFYITGAMVDSYGIDSPLEMAVTDNSIYMLSEFSDGVDIGMLVYDGKVYMIYPAKAAYLEVNDSIMSMMGLSVEDMMGDSSVDFSSFGSLEDAFEVSEAVSGTVKCTVYHIKEETGEMRVYMNGDKLVRFASYSENGTFLSATDVDSISHKVPADKSAPPSDYKRYSGVTGMFTFMSFFSDLS